MGPSDLAKALCGLPLVEDPNLLVGLESGDDAGVYRLSDELAIIQTIDFITPIVDDPYTFGQIAAANALSDVYAMGGRPLTAMNVVCFPVKAQDIAVLGQILRGGLSKMHEASVVLVGGHSVEDEELKYGLSVTGVVHPLRVITRDAARVGDQLILTKPLGTGLVSTAVKGGLAQKHTIDRAAEVMSTLNKTASELMIEAGCHACTDITGFGFLGHASGMVKNAHLAMEVSVSAIPTLPGAKEFAEMGLVPGGTYRNKEFHSQMIEVAGEVSDDMMNILFDPQTSGGLLIAVPAETADALLQKLHQHGLAGAAIVGAITAEPEGKIIIRD